MATFLVSKQETSCPVSRWLSLQFCPRARTVEITLDSWSTPSSFPALAASLSLCLALRWQHLTARMMARRKMSAALEITMEPVTLVTGELFSEHRN